MAQRNPMNDRYQNEKPSGKTRKSAGRAKPAKEPATPTRGKTTAQLTEREKAERRKEQEKIKRRMKADAQRTMTKEERKEQQEKEAAEKSPERVPYVVPATPEYKKWRIIWWVLLGIAVVAVAIAFIGRKQLESNKVFMYGTLIVSYASIFAALGVDFVKIKPMRRAAQAEAMAAQKSGKKRKELEEAAAAEEAAKAEKKGMLPFRSRKKEPEIIVDGDKGDTEEDDE